MSNVKKCTTVPKAVGGQFCLATSESYFSVLRSLSSWCTNIEALRVYCQTMGTKVCITETWIAAAVSGFRLGKPSTAILIGSFKNFPQDLFIFYVFF